MIITVTDEGRVGIRVIKARPCSSVGAKRGTFRPYGKFAVSGNHDTVSQTSLGGDANGALTELLRNRVSALFSLHRTYLNGGPVKGALHCFWRE